VASGAGGHSLSAPLVPSRLCTGCEKKLEITTGHWFFRDSKPTGYCRTCRAKIKTQHDGPYGWVPAEKVRPLLSELVSRCGGITATSEASGLSETAIREVVGRKRPRVQKKTVRLVVLALYERRKVDRMNGGNKNYLEARKKQAKLEDNINRLAGY